MRIDSHQHFWSLEKPYTNWPTPDLTAIYQDFGPSDLYPHLVTNGIDGTILVQAAPSVDETINLLDIADGIPFVKGVVGWVDFESSNVCDQLMTLARRSAFRGVRPMLQGIATPGWILREDFSPVFDLLAQNGLCFDGLVRADQIADLAVIADRYPTLRLVVDHAGKPAIASKAFDQWAADITALATRANAHCKLSGLWTEAGDNHSLAVIAPYVDILVETFGPDRLMWGSDWPVLQLAGTYRDWARQCDVMLARLSDKDRQQIFGGTAARFYGLRDA